MWAHALDACESPSPCKSSDCVSDYLMCLYLDAKDYRHINGRFHYCIYSGNDDEGMTVVCLNVTFIQKPYCLFV